jgi:hypothetical protein
MKRKILITINLLFVIGVAGVLFNSQFARQSVSAQETNTPVLNEQSESVLNKNTGRLEKFNELIEKAQTTGSVKVIIGLQSDFTPEGDLSRSRKLVQRAEIKQSQNVLLEELRSFAVKDIKQFDFIPYMAFEVEATALERMKNSPNVISIQEDELAAPTLQQSISVVGAANAWTAGATGSGRVIAVLDTGVDKNHLFFANGKVVSEACYSTTSGTNPNAGSSVSLCPGGVNSEASGSGVHCDVAQIAGCFHGTHVAGIAAGNYDPAGTSNDYFGVAKDAQILAIQVFSRFNNSTNCGGTAPCVLSYTSDQILGLQRVQALAGTFVIAAVNLSLGGRSEFFQLRCGTSCRYRQSLFALVNHCHVFFIRQLRLYNSHGCSACISTATRRWRRDDRWRIGCTQLDR